MRYSALLLALVALAGGTAAEAQQSPFSSGSRLTRPPDMRLEAPRSVREGLKFGETWWQVIDFFPSGGEAPAPLVVVFGGMGDWVRHRVTAAGFHLAELPPGGRRPKADESIEAYVEALSDLLARSEELRIDPRRIAIMGSGLNGHFAALFGTDPSLLARAGLPFDSLRGIVSVDGRGFDIPARAAESDYLRSVYRRQFGRNSELHADLSPSFHVEAPNAPAFLFLYREDNKEARDESGEMARSLSATAAQVDFVSLPKPREGSPETFFLVTEDGSGHKLMPFLERAVGQ